MMKGYSRQAFNIGIFLGILKVGRTNFFSKLYDNIINYNLEQSTERSTGRSTERSKGRSTERSTGRSTEQSTERSTGRSTEQSTERSAEPSDASLRKIS